MVVETWLGAFLPAGTPVDLVQALSGAVKAASQSPSMAESLASFASESAFETPEQFARTIRDDTLRWGPVVKASGFVATE